MLKMLLFLIYLLVIASYNYLWLWKRIHNARLILKCIPALLLGFYPYALGDYFLLKDHPPLRFDAGVYSFAMGHLWMMRAWMTGEEFLYWYLYLYFGFVVVFVLSGCLLREKPKIRIMVDYTCFLVCWAISSYHAGYLLATCIFLFSDFFLALNMIIFNDKSSLVETISINLYWVSLWLLSR